MLFQVSFWRCPPTLAKSSKEVGEVGIGYSFSKTEQKSCLVNTQTPEQSTGNREAQWTQPWSRVQSQVNTKHLVHSRGTILSVLHLHSVKIYLQKARPIKR